MRISDWSSDVCSADLDGLPLVRAANNGVGGVYDAFGRARAEAGLGTRAVLDADLPQATTESTIYSRLGNWALVVVMHIGRATCVERGGREWEYTVVSVSFTKNINTKKEMKQRR